MFPPRGSENLEKELREVDFYVSYAFSYDYCLWTWIFSPFMNSRDSLLEVIKQKPNSSKH